jgi:hypothetical protein
LEARAYAQLCPCRGVLVLAHPQRGLVPYRRFAQAGALLTTASSPRPIDVMSSVVWKQSIAATSSRIFAHWMSDALSLVFALLAQRLCVWTRHPPWGAAGEPRFPTSTSGQSAS